MFSDNQKSFSNRVYNLLDKFEKNERTRTIQLSPILWAIFPLHILPLFIPEIFKFQTIQLWIQYLNVHEYFYWQPIYKNLTFYSLKSFT